MARPRIVIVGAGFGGLSAAHGLAGADAHVTGIDRRNYPPFQPLLYPVATAGLSPAQIASPIRRILTAFEQAEQARDPEARRRFLTFVVIGGGPTGVEMAGAIAELAHVALRNDFRTINPQDAHIVLVEAGPRVLPAFPPTLSES